MHWIDPESLPKTMGTVTQFLFNSKGESDGVLLDKGRQVHLPPHLSAELLDKIKTGDKITVRGVRPRGAAVIAAISITGPKGTVLDEGPTHLPPPKTERATKAVQIDSVVKQTLYSPKGEVCGALLESGQILRMPPKENAALAPWLQVKCKVSAWGDAMTVRGQTVVALTDLALRP